RPAAAQVLESTSGPVDCRDAGGDLRRAPAGSGLPAVHRARWHRPYEIRRRADARRLDGDDLASSRRCADLLCNQRRFPMRRRISILAALLIAFAWVTVARAQTADYYGPQAIDSTNRVGSWLSPAQHGLSYSHDLAT